MNIKLHFMISAGLPPGQESLGQVAGRVSKLLSLLPQIDPLLSDWYQPVSPDTRIPLSPDISGLEKAIYAQSCINGATSPSIEFGYYLGASNSRDSDGWTPQSMALMMKAGGPNVNKIWFHTGFGVVPDPRLVAYGTVKKILFAMADAFEPEYSSAYPMALDRDSMVPMRPKRPIFVGWMVLLPRHLASQIAPPPQAIQQTREDGSLFLAATDEQFDATNPAHVAASKAIQDAILPVNVF